MLIQLPAETWIEILDWLRRRDLIKKLDQLWDREFTPIVQDWLHKYTKNVSIGTVLAKENVLASFYNNQWEKVPIAEVEMPANITSFQQISIRNQLDPTMLAFFHRMQPMFRNLCLEINYDGRDLPMPIPYQNNFRLLMPLIGDQIESIILDSPVLQFLADNFPPAFRFNVRLLSIWYYRSDDHGLLINWLFTPHEDGQPRTLTIDNFELFDDFYAKVFERFTAPTRQLASPFFVRFNYSHEYGINGELIPQLPFPLVTENTQTGELLTLRVVKHSTVNQYYWLMTNCYPKDMNGEGQAKKAAELIDWDWYTQERKIFLDSYTLEDVDIVDQQQQLADDHDS